MAKKTIKLDHVPGLAQEVSNLLEEEMLLKDKWEISKVKNILVDEAKQLQEMRDTLLKKYGTLSKDEKQYTFEDKKKEEAYSSEFKELLEKEIKIESKIDFKVIETIKSANRYDLIFLLA